MLEEHFPLEFSLSLEEKGAEAGFGEASLRAAGADAPWDG
jgi:hypothetical protein